MTEPVLECQECGEVICRLSPSEVQQVAENPERFILTCSTCTRELNW